MASETPALGQEIDFLNTELIIFQKVIDSFVTDHL
jgi:hypothetical protein